MSSFSLRIHISKLKLLVPLHSSYNKLFIKVIGLEETKIVNIPSITTSKFSKNNGIFEIEEDLEFKLNAGANKLTLNVYAHRTFMEDILLFSNDVSLVKALSTENIVKLESKLFNIDKVHVASIYLEMQRKGAILRSTDLISNFTQELNLESTKRIKDPDLSKEENKKQEAYSARPNSQQRPYKQLQSEKQLPSALEITQQILGIPSLKIGSKKKQEIQNQDIKSIPDLDAFELSDNFQRFVKSLDYPVALYEYLYDIFTIERIKDTILFLLIASIGILYYELAFCAMPLVIVLLIFYNFYMKKSFKRPEVNYVKNMRFIQMLMGQTSDLISVAYEFIEDFLYWKQPDKAIILIKELMKLSLCCFTIFFIKIRILIVIGLWIAVLSNSEFCCTMMTLLVNKIILALELINTKIIGFILRKKDMSSYMIGFPFQNSYKTIKNYLQRRFLYQLKKSKSKSNNSIDELMDKFGEENTELSPHSGNENDKTQSLRIRQMMNLEDLKNKQQNLKIEQQSNSNDDIKLKKNNQRYQSPPNNNNFLDMEIIDKEESKCKSKKSSSDKKDLNNSILQHQLQANLDLQEYEEDCDTPVPNNTQDNDNKNGKQQGAERRVFITYENQRWWLSSWTSTLLPGERYNWSDNNGHMYLPKDHFQLPGNDWDWETIWHVEKNPNFTDEEGWIYANDFNGPFHKNQGIFDVVRKRKWVRICYLKQQNEKPEKDFTQTKENIKK